MKKGRMHHYVFAHRVLPKIAVDDPLGFMGAMASPEGPDLLLRLWDDVGKSIAAGGEEPALPSEGLGVRALNYHGLPCVLIVMPRPEGATECYYTILMLERLPTQDELAGGKGPRCHYFTLELGWSSEKQSPRTVLCGWKDETHLNYGTGPEPEPEAFLAAALRLMPKS